jgi:O-acetyl-ADP-ribose deacetylase (regulator of RNase III)
MQVHVVLADVVELPVDAIVVPTDSSGQMNEGLALAAKARAGEAVEREVVQCAPIAVGAAVVTPGGGLFAKHVIHVPIVEEPGLKITIEAVRRATRAALLAAAAHCLNVVALPFMGRRPSELTNGETARAMVDELRAHRHPYPATIYLADPWREIAALYEEALRAGQ